MSDSLLGQLVGLDHVAHGSEEHAPIQRDDPLQQIKIIVPPQMEGKQEVVVRQARLRRGVLRLLVAYAYYFVLSAVITSY